MKIKNLTNQILENRREKIGSKEERAESERKSRDTSRRRMIVPRLPQKALKSTYIIRD